MDFTKEHVEYLKKYSFIEDAKIENGKVALYYLKNGKTKF